MAPASDACTLCTAADEKRVPCARRVSGFSLAGGGRGGGSAGEGRDQPDRRNAAGSHRLAAAAAAAPPPACRGRKQLLRARGRARAAPHLSRIRPPPAPFSPSTRPYDVCTFRCHAAAATGLPPVRRRRVRSGGHHQTRLVRHGTRATRARRRACATGQYTRRRLKARCGGWKAAGGAVEANTEKLMQRRPREELLRPRSEREGTSLLPPFWGRRVAGAGPITRGPRRPKPRGHAEARRAEGAHIPLKYSDFLGCFQNMDFTI